MYLKDRTLVLTNTDIDHVFTHSNEPCPCQNFAIGLEGEMWMNGITEDDFDRIEIDLDPRDKGHTTLIQRSEPKAIGNTIICPYYDGMDKAEGPHVAKCKALPPGRWLIDQDYRHDYCQRRYQHCTHYRTQVDNPYTG